MPGSAVKYQGTIYIGHNDSAIDKEGSAWIGIAV
jgi:hypothetical protein